MITKSNPATLGHTTPPTLWESAPSQNLLVRAAQDLSRYREVLYHLVVRDLRIRHKHTKLGVLWSLFNPVLQLLVLTVIFSHVVRIEMQDYWLYAFAGLLPWMFFQASWHLGAYALIDNQNFIRKVYLPKLIFPVGRVLVRLVDYLVSLVVMCVMAALLGHGLHLSMVALPLAVLLFFIFALGVAMLAAVTAVYIRDLLHLQTVLAQALYLATPVIYPISALPASYRPFISSNPVYVMIRPFHDIIYTGTLPSLYTWFAAVIVAAVSLLLGLIVMHKADANVVHQL